MWGSCANMIGLEYLIDTHRGRCMFDEGVSVRRMGLNNNKRLHNKVEVVAVHSILENGMT